jgi:hypothetical protein
MKHSAKAQMPGRRGSLSKDSSRYLPEVKTVVAQKEGMTKIMR